MNDYPVIMDEILCEAVEAQLMMATLRADGPVRLVDLDAARFPELTARIRRLRALHGGTNLVCGDKVASIHVVSDPNGPVIRVYWPS